MRRRIRLLLVILVTLIMRLRRLFRVIINGLMLRIRRIRLRRCLVIGLLRRCRGVRRIRVMLWVTCFLLRWLVLLIRRRCRLSRGLRVMITGLVLTLRLRYRMKRRCVPTLIRLVLVRWNRGLSRWITLVPWLAGCLSWTTIGIDTSTSRCRVGTSLAGSVSAGMASFATLMALPSTAVVHVPDWLLFWPYVCSTVYLAPGL